MTKENESRALRTSSGGEETTPGSDSDPSLRVGARPRIVLGITGATGAIFGIRILERLVSVGADVHLVMSQWGQRTIEHETDYAIDDLRQLATENYSNGNLAAALSSGSFLVDGMIIAPCSAKTLAGIAHGVSDNLIGRAADVALKERRKLVLLARETPLSEIHLENMLRLSRMGATILPPMPAFYNAPASIDDLVDHITVRALDQFGLLGADDGRRWGGIIRRRASDPR